MRSRSSIPLVVVSVVACGAVGWVLGSPPDRSPAPVEVVPMEPPTVVLVVHVGGEVARPGLVEVEDGARVADAVRAAGGLLPGAAIDAVNLARPLSDGEQVVVPGRGATGASADPARIRVNTATASELEALPGIGPVLAGRIVAHRDGSGPFREAEDLLAVPGIGERMLEQVRDLVEVP